MSPGVFLPFYEYFIPRFVEIAHIGWDLSPPALRSAIYLFLSTELQPAYYSIKMLSFLTISSQVLRIPLLLIAFFLFQSHWLGKWVMELFPQSCLTGSSMKKQSECLSTTLSARSKKALNLNTSRPINTQLLNEIVRGFVHSNNLIVDFGRKISCAQDPDSALNNK